MVGEEHTIVGPHVQALFESPEDVHLLDRRAIRWSQVVHGERAQCELHDNGPVVPLEEPSSGCAVCAFRWPATMPISMISTSGQIKGVRRNSLPRVKRRSKRASMSVRGSTWRGRRQHPRRFQVVVVGEANSLSDAPRRRPGGRGRCVPVQGVLLLAALLPRRRPDDEDREQLLLVDGATRLAGPNPVSHPPHEPPFDRQREGSGGGGRTRGGRGGRVHVELSADDAGGTANREGRPRPFLRKSPETAGVREGPQDDGRTDDRTGAPQWRVRERRSRLAR